MFKETLEVAYFESSNKSRLINLEENDFDIKEENINDRNVDDFDNIPIEGVLTHIFDKQYKNDFEGFSVGYYKITFEEDAEGEYVLLNDETEPISYIVEEEDLTTGVEIYFKYKNLCFDINCNYLEMFNVMKKQLTRINIYVDAI